MFRRTQLSQEEQEVVEKVEREMVLEGGKLTASYPWKDCGDKMRCNYRQVQKIQEKIEARSIADGTYPAFQVEMKKTIAAGAVRKLSPEELEFEEPINYNKIFGVINEGSTSTRLRIVLNSALMNI